MGKVGFSALFKMSEKKVLADKGLSKYEQNVRICPFYKNKGNFKISI